MSTRTDSIAESLPPQQHSPVYINVYDLRNARNGNRCLHPLGMGIYHTAISIGKQEFTFGGNTRSDDSGIYITPPRGNRAFSFKYAIPVFNSKDPEEPILAMTEFQIYHVLIPRLGRRYKANRYDILVNNCNHFTEEFLR